MYNIPYTWNRINPYCFKENDLMADKKDKALNSAVDEIPMKPHLLMITSFFVFAVLFSCGDREDASVIDDTSPASEMKRIVVVLQSDG